MNYEFPLIQNISDVLPVIEGRSEFVIREQEGITFIDYLYVKRGKGIDTFPPVTDRDSAILRECRGIAFYTDDGRICSRPLHKFFNVGEMEETKLSSLLKLGNFTMHDKFDGSMVRPIFFRDGTMRFATRKGFSYQAHQAMAVDLDLYYHDFIHVWCREGGYTPVFEFISPDNRIVLSYPESKLVLLAVRDNLTGLYLKQCDLPAHIKLPEPAASGLGSLEYTLAAVPSKTKIEGYVLDFAGHKVKIKTEEYCKFHRAKDLARHEKDLIACFIDGGYDDLLSLLQGHDRIAVEEYHKDFWAGLEVTMARIVNVLENVPEDRKGVALKITGELHQSLAPVSFMAYDMMKKSNFPVWEAVVMSMDKYILGRLTNQTNVDQMRHLWGGGKFQGKIIVE